MNTKPVFCFIYAYKNKLEERWENVKMLIVIISEGRTILYNYYAFLSFQNLH